ncbi:MAG TPA: FecR family protein [Polyangia bacterium]|nr:FecR family protein [Polyangia bacterium]
MKPPADERVPGDATLESMVRLVRRTFPDGGRVDEAGLRRLRERGPRPRRGRRLAFGALGLLVAALPLALVLALRPGPLTFEVIHGSMIRFSDGTEIVLERAARAQVRDVAAHGAGIVLFEGRAHTSFIPRPKASWQVLAGPYVVRVTGTVFDVEWSRDHQQLDVWMQKGSVVVTGPMVEAGVAVSRDQHLSLRPDDRRIVLEKGSVEQPEAPVEAPPPAPPPEPVAEHKVERAAIHGTDPSVVPWGRRLAQGDFEAVIVDAERRGVREVLTRGTRADLAALADAARYTRRADLARRALIAERARFAGSTAAREAGYFLGVLSEDEQTWQDALEWYARYRREDPAGTYAGPALGRTMVLEARHQGNGAARADAQEYLSRFPSGPYAPTAQQVLRAAQ